MKLNESHIGKEVREEATSKNSHWGLLDVGDFGDLWLKNANGEKFSSSNHNHWELYSDSPKKKPMKFSEVCCGKCHFYASTELQSHQHEYYPNGKGFCRRYPPKQDVQGNDWCGCFEVEVDDKQGGGKL